MAFYSNWCKQQTQQTINNVPASTLLTPAQVTVCSNRDKLVYNIEYKQIAPERTTVNKQLSRTLGRRNREASTSNTFAAANAVAARFHTRTNSRQHSRKFSVDSYDSNSSAFSVSTTMSDLCEDSMWDDWILKSLDKNSIQVEDTPMEDWIFKTKI